MKSRTAVYIFIGVVILYFVWKQWSASQTAATVATAQPIGGGGLSGIASVLPTITFDVGDDN